jgi:hypothetical protein
MSIDGTKTEAGGNASVAIGGDAPGARVTTTHAEAHPGGKVEINNYYSSPNEQRASLVSALGIARASRRATRAFLDEYLVSETGEVAFGGRDGELRYLDDWLFDPKAASRMLVAAPAGRGKSALLVHWMESLRKSPPIR